MAAQAKFCRSGRLRQGTGFQRRACIQIVDSRLQLLVPKRGFRRGIMGRMAENTNAAFRRRFDRTRPGDRKIVLRVHYVGLRKAKRNVEKKETKERRRPRLHKGSQASGLPRCSRDGCGPFCSPEGCAAL